MMLSPWRPVWGFQTELLRVLGMQSWPFELHRFAAHDPPDGLGRQESVEHIEADVPARRTHGYESTIDVVPESEPRTRSEWLELPSHLVVTPLILEQLRRVSPSDARLRDLWRRIPTVESLTGPSSSGSGQRRTGPLAQLRGVRQRVPDFRRRMLEVPNDDKRPFLAILANFGARRGTRL